ncbi:MAG: hypothetical protein IPO05_13605 [Flavobacteriales bacterium]|nr:hypothetical protein [Flavobacteriales bacterium]
MQSARDSWREGWLGCINALTSIELQRKAWLDRTNTNPSWSFVEFMCSYFDDLSIDNNYKIQVERRWVTSNELEVIKNWHEALSRYQSPNNDDYDDESILNDPKWLSIVQLGVVAKRTLTDMLGERETNVLNEEIDYLKYQ